MRNESDEIIIPEIEDIESITLKKGKDLIFITRKATGGFKWEITKPLKCSGDLHNISIYGLTRKEDYKIFDADPSDIEYYGLSTPEYTLEYGTKKDTVRLYLGKKFNNDTQIYATFDKRKVYAILLADPNFFDKPLMYIAESFIYIVHISDVSKLQVKFDDKVINCDIEAYKGSPKKDIFTVNGKSANVIDSGGNSLFRLFYSSVIGVTFDDIEIGAFPKGKAEATFTYTLKTAPHKMVVEFVPKDQNYYYVLKNKKYTNFIVAKKEFDKPDGLREAYKKIMTELQKQHR